MYTVCCILYCMMPISNATATYCIHLNSLTGVGQDQLSVATVPPHHAFGIPK